MSIKNTKTSSSGNLIFCPHCNAKITPGENHKGLLKIICPRCKERFKWNIKEYPWSKKFQEFKEIIENNISEIEKRDDLSTEEKVSKVVKIISATCAALATQPLPGMDIFYLTPIQGYMGIKISEIRGLGFKDSEIKTMIKELLGIIGLGMAGQNFVLTAYKIGVPYVGGLMTIPLVYGATYGIGKVMDYYFLKKAKKETISKSEIINLWKKAKKEGKTIYKSKKDKADV